MNIYRKHFSKTCILFSRAMWILARRNVMSPEAAGVKRHLTRFYPIAVVIWNICPIDNLFLLSIICLHCCGLSLTNAQPVRLPVPERIPRKGSYKQSILLQHANAPQSGKVQYLRKLQLRNHQFINRYPIPEWFGNSGHRIRPCLHHSGMQCQCVIFAQAVHNLQMYTQYK
jgi:hypothetical protein